MRILLTGSAGFIGGYLVPELLDAGHSVIGVDNFSKYGRVEKSFDTHENFTFIEGDARWGDFLYEAAEGCDLIIAGAARIGGISYFHKYAFDLMADNEAIMAATYRAAIERQVSRVVVISSSMVYENATLYPTPEGHERRCPPPSSTYGFQKLACEYFAQGAWEQYGMPFTIVRPFNCVGIGEVRALGASLSRSGNIQLALSHVVPDLCQKIIRGQDPVEILGNGDQVRCYTYGGDLARGIRLAAESPAAVNQDFNLSTPAETTVLELLQAIYREISGDPKGNIAHRCVPGFSYDVQRRVPSVTKAERILGFKAETTLQSMLTEVVPWIRAAIEKGII